MVAKKRTPRYCLGISLSDEITISKWFHRCKWGHHFDSFSIRICILNQSSSTNKRLSCTPRLPQNYSKQINSDSDCFCLVTLNLKFERSAEKKEERGKRRKRKKRTFLLPHIDCCFVILSLFFAFFVSFSRFFWELKLK